MPETEIARASAPTPLPDSGTWTLDSNHSTATFSVVHHQVATFRAPFVNIKGEFDGAAQRLVGHVAVAGILLPAHMERLRSHLMTPDFLDAEGFPTFTFSSTRITKDGESLAVDGELTLKGVTKAVTGVGIYHPQRTVRTGNGAINERFGIDLTTTIDRRDFGISFNNTIAEGVANLGWLVKIEAALEFIEKTGE